MAAAVFLLPVMLVEQGWAWGDVGHRLINRSAAAALPAEVPEFLRDDAGKSTIEYLGPEPDRWKTMAEPELNAAGSPEHFIDLEYADLLGPLPRRRYDFVRALAFAQRDHPDLPLSPEKVGLQPYVTLEVWERLKAGMREYRRLAAANGDTRPAELTVLFYAGWLGHYVADGSMPLHTTIQYNGWTGPNPNRYTTEHKIHALFETVYVSANVRPEDVTPLVGAAKPKLIPDVWTGYLGYLRHSHELVEQTYALEKTGAFAGPGTPEGKAMVDERLAAGAIELRDLIYTAWVKSAEPVPEGKGGVPPAAASAVAPAAGVKELLPGAQPPPQVRGALAGGEIH